LREAERNIEITNKEESVLEDCEILESSTELKVIKVHKLFNNDPLKLERILDHKSIKELET
jgi:hypothetical protein